MRRREWGCDGMRLLVALTVAQALLLILFGVRLFALDARLHEFTNSAAAMQVEAAHAAKAPRVSAAIPQDGLSVDELRQVIREELAALGERQPQSSYQASVSAPPVQSNPSPSAETDMLAKQLSQDLDYYMSKGSISEAEMSEFQQKMARLPADQRAQMRRKLTKAISAGDVQGRL